MVDFAGVVRRAYNRTAAIHHTRMRLGASTLNLDLFVIGLLRNVNVETRGKQVAIFFCIVHYLMFNMFNVIVSYCMFEM